MRDLASARIRYRELLKSDADPRALKGLAMTEIKDSRYDTALELLKSYNQKTSQRDWQAMNALGFAEDQLGHSNEAEAAYLAAATLSPSHGAPMNNLGMMYMRNGRHDDAVRAFTLALNRQPDLSVADLNRRIAYGLKGDLNKAISGADERDRSAVYNSLGAAALSRGDTAAARRMFRKALESSPVFYENAYANLERTLPASGN
jgi:Flp pilus assembly protein TadD